MLDARQRLQAVNAELTGGIRLVQVVLPEFAWVKVQATQVKEVDEVAPACRPNVHAPLLQADNPGRKVGIRMRAISAI
jgi:hypothetical protein